MGLRPILDSDEAQVEFIEDPDRWPVWPHLPMKNTADVNESGFSQMGFIFGDPTRPLRIYLGNMYALQKPDEREYVEFKSAAAAVAAGWRVD